MPEALDSYLATCDKDPILMWIRQNSDHNALTCNLTISEPTELTLPPSGYNVNVQIDVQFVCNTADLANLSGACVSLNLSTNRAWGSLFLIFTGLWEQIFLIKQMFTLFFHTKVVFLAKEMFVCCLCSLHHVGYFRCSIVTSQRSWKIHEYWMFLPD